MTFRQSASLLAIIVWTSTAHAQSPVPTDSAAQPPGPKGGLEEIVVTAQKRSENLQKVPISVQSFTAEKLAVAGVISTRDIQAVASGVTFAANGGTLEPFIRGVGSTNNSPGSEQPVGIYVDGVYLASPTQNLLGLADVAQISVLKGPQGTLFGRNATGGVIQIATRDPVDHLQLDVNAGYESFNTVRVGGYVSTPLTDGLGVSFSGNFAHQGDGWGKNLVTGNDVRKVKHDIALRNKWVWAPGPKTKIKLALDYSSRADNVSPGFRLFPGGGPGLFNDAYTPRNPWDIASYFDPHARFKAGGGALTIDQDLDFARVVAITSLRADQLHWDLDLTAAPRAGQRLIALQKANQLTQEVQFLSPTASAVKWAAGVYYFKSEGRVDPFDIFNYPAYYEELGQAPNTLHLQAFGRQRTESIAGFAQATFEILPNLDLTAGGRYTTEKRNFDGSFAIVDDSGPVAYIVPPARDRLSFSKFTWRGALDYRVTADALLYISATRGFKSGGFNLYAPGSAPYRPETLDVYEGGFKTEWFDRHLRINGGLFLYDYKNIQVNRYESGTQIVVNGARARTKGAELEVQAEPVSGLTLTTALQYLDAKYRDFPNAPISIQDPVTGLYVPSDTGFQAKGQRLPYAPRFTLNLGANYRTKLSNGSTLNLNINDYHSSKYYSEPDNFLHQRAYDLLGAAVAWTSSNERYSVTVFGRNLFNRAVFTQMSTQAIGRVEDTTNQPRTFGVTLGYKLR